MKLCWFDAETTGLESHKHSLLEVAYCFAELEDPFNVGEMHQHVIWFPPTELKNLDPFIVNMHTKNGLLKQCTQDGALDAFEVEALMLERVPDAALKDDKVVLAGSAIDFDHGFITSWMPKLAKRLSHRHYDVSALKLFCMSQGMPKLAKAEAHRAADDIIESIDHAKQCRAWLKENL